MLGFASSLQPMRVIHFEQTQIVTTIYRSQKTHALPAQATGTAA